MEIIERMVGTLVTAGVVEGNQAQMCTYVLTDTLKDCNIDEVKTKEVIVSGTQKNSDAIKYFMIVCATSNRSPRTIDSEVRAVRKLLLEIQKPYDEITGDEILAWFAHHKIRTGCSDVTMSNYQHFISAFYRTMKKHDKIKYNPMEKMEPIKHASKLKTPLTVMEIESVKGACHNSRDLAIVTMMLETGVRVSELCGMNKRDVDFINCTAVVLGKGNKERMV
jgi:integrase/recombinase XerD